MGSQVITLDTGKLNERYPDVETEPPVGHLSVTPSNTDMFWPPLRELRIGGAGDVNIKMLDGTTALYVGGLVGEYISGQIVQVLSTSTTATNIVGRY